MVVRSILCGILSRWNTASLRLIQDSRRSPSIRHICGHFFLNKKQETCSCKKIEMLTSYDGIIHIRLKGRSSITSSQPASQAPLYLIVTVFYTLCAQIARGGKGAHSGAKRFSRRFWGVSRRFY